MRVLEEGAEGRLPTPSNQTSVRSRKPGGVSKKLPGTARWGQSTARENELESGQTGDRRACNACSVSSVNQLVAASAGWFSPTASGLCAGTLFPVCAEWHASWMRRFPHRAEPPPPPRPGTPCLLLAQLLSACTGSPSCCFCFFKQITGAFQDPVTRFSCIPNHGARARATHSATSQKNQEPVEKDKREPRPPAPSTGCWG